MHGKRIHILLLFIANFILLAHSVIPHDHSEGLVSVFMSDEDSEQGSDAFGGITSPFHDCSFFCSLDDPMNVSRHEPCLNDYYYVCTGKLLFEEIRKVISSPALIYYNTTYISRTIKSSGLRGPPAA